MRVRLEVQLAPPAIGYVRIELRRRQIRVPEHLLDGAQVRASFEQVRCKRVPQEVRVDAFGLEPGLRGQAAEDEEDSGASEWSAACIEEELLSVAPLEERPAASKVEAEGLRRLASDRNDAFLIPLAEAPDEPVLEVDRLPVEPDCLADA